MQIEEILEYWAKHVEYDPDQKHFNLLSSNYEFHRCGKIMKMIMEEYDPSGLLAVMYAKLRYREILGQCKISLFDIVEDPNCVSEYVKMWRMFNSAEVSEAEDRLIENFNSILSNIEGCLLIGEENKNEALKRIYDAIGDVCETLNKCNLEVYVKGNKEIKMDGISNYIHIFDTIAEALVFIEKAPDMTYICYIRQFQSPAGYFAVIVKSNGTILSVNDRVNERYIGQHQNSRNGRWQDSKQYDLFPYSKIVQDVDGRDYKGYAVNYVVSKENVPLKVIGAESYTHLTLAVILLQNKLSHYDLYNAEITYTNALLPNSVLLSGNTTSKTTDLIPVAGSLIVKKHDQLPLGFTDEEVVTGSVSAKFDRNLNHDNPDSGWYSKRNQILVDLYGYGFHADQTKLVRYDKTMMLSDGISETIVSEYVGNEYKMQAQAYRGARRQLAAYIKNNMQKELDAFGGPKAVDAWFFDLIERKKDLLIRKAVEMYYEVCIAQTRNNTEFSYYCISCSDKVQVGVIHSEHINCGGFHILNTRKDNTHYYCPITNTTANVWIQFSPQTAENLKDLFDEKDLPKIIEGWVLTNSIYGYNGNSLLDNVDPVSEIQHILAYCSNWDYLYRKSFRFAVGFSKRGLNKLLNQRKENVVCV